MENKILIQTRFRVENIQRLSIIYKTESIDQMNNLLQHFWNQLRIELKF